MCVYCCLTNTKAVLFVQSSKSIEGLKDRLVSLVVVLFRVSSDVKNTSTISTVALKPRILQQIEKYAVGYPQLFILLHYKTIHGILTYCQFCDFKCCILIGWEGNNASMCPLNFVDETVDTEQYKNTTLLTFVNVSLVLTWY